MSLTVGELFAGIAGFGLAFERAGFECRWQVEIDGKCRQLLAAKFPGATQLGDVRGCGAHNLESVDVLCGGSPCQGFSVAGLRGGMSDDRSNLTAEFCRITNELEPTVIVWENVPGVLSMRDNAFGCLLAALVGADAPLVSILERGRWTDAGVVAGPRRTAAWRVLDAQFFGLAQRRRRVFLVASPRTELPEQILFERKSLRGNPAPRREAGEEVAGTLTGGADGGRSHGRKSGTDLEGFLIAPALSASGRGTSRAGESRGQDCVIPVNLPTVAGCLQERDVKGADSDTKPGHLICVAAFDERVITSPGNRSTVEPDQPSPSLNGSGGMSVCFKPSHFTRGKDGALSDISPPLTADADKGDQEPVVLAFPQNLSGTQRATTENLSPVLQADNPTAIVIPNTTSCKDQNGLGITDGTAPMFMLDGASQHAVQVQWASGGGQVENDTAQALRSGAEHNYQFARQGMQVRRLMPVECERLMGFPDNHTAAFSDSARYRMLGNAVAVPVVEWIARRLAASLKGRP